jgi:hypothetical protein
MKHFYRLLPFLAAVLAIGCSDETTVFQDGLEDDLYLEENAALLQGAIGFSEAGVLEILGENTLAGKGEEQAGDYPLTLIATVSPPASGTAEALTASHVDLDGDFAYVSYNTVGETYRGGIDVVDISDPHNPRVSSRLIYLNADINSLTFDNGFIYAAGGVNAETSVRATSNSFVARIPVTAGRISTETILYGFQQGYNATDVVVEPSRILVSSGKEGSITTYRKDDLGIVAEAYVADARAMAPSGNGLAILDAGSGVRMLNESLEETALIPVTSDLGEATKKTLDFWQGNLAVAEAGKGAGIYSAEGALLQYLPIPLNPEGAAAGDIVTNAVTANEEALFMANGAAGLSLSEAAEAGIEAVGIIELPGSINYVSSRGDYAFAASGTSGLQIIKLNRPQPGLQGRCSDLPPYEGSSKLNVGAADQLAFSGEKRFNNININGALLLCGSWTVVNHVDVKNGATFELFGTLAVGRNTQKRNLKVGEGALLRIEGDLTIYGDLILMEGARLEVLGSDSAIDIFGSVKYEGEATVTGTFRDVRGKFR